MSTHPRLESRVTVLERRQTNLEALMEELFEDVTANLKQIDTRFDQVDARVTELSRDMTASFKQLVEYHIQQENQIDTRFDQVDTRFDKIENRLDKIETTMATKEDLAGMATKEDIVAIRADMTAMEGRILDTLKQLLATSNPQNPPQQ